MVRVAEKATTAAVLASEVIGVVFLEEDIDLFCEEKEQFAGSFGNHELLWDRDFRLDQIEGRVSIELDRTDAEIGSPKIDGKIQALFQSVAELPQLAWGVSSGENRLAFSVPSGTPVTYVGIWLRGVPFFCRPSSTLWLISCSFPRASLWALTHFAEEFLHHPLHTGIVDVKLSGNPLSLFAQRHLVWF